MREVLVIDIGGTFIKYARMDESFALLEKGKIPTPDTCRADLIEAIGRLYDSMPSVEGIAISMPGIIDTENGYCHMGGAITYNNEAHLRDELKDRCPVNVFMGNDAKCAALAEAGRGALSGVKDGFVILLGTMIGGAYIHDGKLVYGKHFSAGEVSYINTRLDELPRKETVWGNVSGASGLCRDYAVAIGEASEKVDGVRVFADVLAGDETAIRVLTEYTRKIASVIFNIQTVLDPERFAIGGGISEQPVLIDYIRKNLEEMYESCPYSVPKAEVVACEFRNDANLVGALEGYFGIFAEKENL